MKVGAACGLGALLLLGWHSVGAAESIDLGGRLSSSRGVLVWWGLSSAAKIQPQTAPPENYSPTVQFRGARNEYESVQVIVRPTRALQHLALQLSGLTGPRHATISSGDLELLRALYLNVTTPTDKSASPGLWPDPLLPVRSAMDVPAGTNQAFWIRVHVRREAAPGRYQGLLRMRAEGWTAKIPLELTVYNFTLPDEMTCQTAFGFSPGEVFRYNRLNDEATKRKVLDAYWADLSAHHVSPYDPAPLDSFKVTWPKLEPPAEPKHRTELCAPADQLNATIDFSAWDKSMTRAFDTYHFNSFSVPIPGLGGGTFHELIQPTLQGFGEDAPEYPLLLGSYCRQIEAHLREKGWLKQAYIYWFDEPSEQQFPYLQNGFDKLKQYCPDITRMITKRVEPGLVGGPNLWCAISHEYNAERAEERRRLGERFWWYVCTGPKAPYAGLFLDHSAPEMRIWLWQTFQRGINGILVWQCNYWTSDTAYPDPAKRQNPYDDSMSWMTGYGTPAGKRSPWGNGDGRFIYPPLATVGGTDGRVVLEGPVDSIRWEQLRDGIEDYEYLTILKRKIDDRRSSLPAAKVREYEALLQVPESITRSMTEFTPDGRPIELRRDQIARAIESL